MPVPDDRPAAEFRLLVVPGVTVDRWSRAWSERQPDVALRIVPADAGGPAALLAAGADAGLLRLPVDQELFHAIPLYTEATVVVVPGEHLLAAAEEVTVGELSGESIWRPLDDVLDWTAAAGTVADHRPATTAAAVELVAAGVGVLVVPQSLARAHHRRALTYRVVADAPTSSVGLVWRRDRGSDLVQEMIGIVRGRTANSTRGQAPAPPPSAQAASRPAPAPRRTSAQRGPTPRRKHRKG